MTLFFIKISKDQQDLIDLFVSNFFGKPNFFWQILDVGKLEYVERCFCSLGTLQKKLVHKRTKKSGLCLVKSVM